MVVSNTDILGKDLAPFASSTSAPTVSEELQNGALPFPQNSRRNERTSLLVTCRSASPTHADRSWSSRTKHMPGMFHGPNYGKVEYGNQVSTKATDEGSDFLS